ncbi:MAG: DUF3280 domain-containing protein [Hyphomicrobiaceae bacterium]|nr:DUF3280 domain-containing protein [Hyphomicrobiaceae bacterium]
MRRVCVMLVLGMLLAAPLALALAAPASAAAKLMLFPFELIDATAGPAAYGYDAPGGLPTGPSQAETDRLKTITGDLAARIAKDGRYEIVPSAAVAAEIEAKRPISQCNGCEDDIARSAGATKAIVATVEKLSDLLFNFKLYLRDVEAQKLEAIMSTTVQGSTDEAWLRGVRYLAERQLFAAKGATQ